jgi:YVTN family beta-propeller protein
VNQLATVNVETEAVSVLTLDGPNMVLGHGAMAPDGRTLAMATHMPHVLFFDLFDPARPRLDGSVDVGRTPWHPIYSDDGRTLYVPDKDSNDITVIDAKTREVVKTITGTGISEPYGSAVSPDGRYVFFSNNNAKGAYASKNAAAPSDIGTVAVIDTRSNELVKVIEVGKGPTGMGTRHAR